MIECSCGKSKGGALFRNALVKVIRISLQLTQSKTLMSKVLSNATHLFFLSTIRECKGDDIHSAEKSHAIRMPDMPRSTIRVDQ